MEHHENNGKREDQETCTRSFNAEKLPSHLVGSQPEKPGGQRRETPGSHCCIRLRKKRNIHPSSQDGKPARP